MMKYYYKLFVREGLEESLRYINAPEKFIEEMKIDPDFKANVDQKMEEYYIGYDVEKIRKGKSAWTWCPVKDYYRVNWNFKGEVHPHRKDKISQLKKLWENNESTL